MLDRPMNLICPSLNCVAFSNTARHFGGLMKGSKPSTTSIIAKAPSNRSQNVDADNAYFFEAAEVGAEPPRIALKNSLLGSTTITSLLLRKLARYASRLR